MLLFVFYQLESILLGYLCTIIQQYLPYTPLPKLCHLPLQPGRFHPFRKHRARGWYNPVRHFSGQRRQPTALTPLSIVVCLDVNSLPLFHFPIVPMPHEGIPRDAARHHDAAQNFRKELRRIKVFAECGCHGRVVQGGHGLDGPGDLAGVALAMVEAGRSRRLA